MTTPNDKSGDNRHYNPDDIQNHPTGLVTTQRIILKTTQMTLSDDNARCQHYDDPYDKETVDYQNEIT
jgi:hypothetical protein